MMWVLAGPALGAVALYIRHRHLTWLARRHVVLAPVLPPRRSADSGKSATPPLARRVR